MTKVQGFILFICSVAALIGACLWYHAAPDYEPALAIIASLSGLVGSYWPLKPKKSRVTPEQKIAARDKWRPIFEKFFLEKAQHDYGTDAIIHDVARVDCYPDATEEKGISPWFRCGLMGTYHRGVLLGLQWTHIIQQVDGTWEENSRNTEGTKVILIGAIPYESVESVNFDGDDYYDFPHLFCHFEYKGQPYERLYYATENRLQHPTIKHQYYYTEIAKYEPKKPSRSFIKRPKEKPIFEMEIEESAPKSPWWRLF
ncbi:hypothetical protein [Rhizobium rhododendri]|uniref:Uncharacterized protein n=1 Tax=Rhizobium rhododendri TaxID=2506430 RepID=A0ABY8IKP3_9HYPH|nr:hypothetical protein [Rhizobium rhododendri]WFS23932.1 hypothetical protein PR018_05375 [Rhizobium rhododendri]